MLPILSYILREARCGWKPRYWQKLANASWHRVLGERQMRTNQLKMKAIGYRLSAISQKIPLAAVLMPTAESREPTALRQVDSILPLA